MRRAPDSWKKVYSKLGTAWRKRKRRQLPKQYVCPLRFETMEDRRMLAILTVNSLSDTHINTDGVLTLREAVEVVQQGSISGLDSSTATNQISGASLGNNDTINFASTLNGGTITLSLILGEIGFSKSLIIDASGLLNGVIINGNDPTPGHTGQGIRVFDISDTTAGVTPPAVSLVNLTIKGADVGGFFPSQGGAVRSQGLLTLRNCTIKENQADDGAVYAEVAGGGTTSRNVLTIENCDIENNEAFNGAGIYVVAGNTTANSDTISITGSTIRHNTALSSGNGAGLYLDLHGNGTYGPHASVVDSTITLNDGGSGAGAYAQLQDAASLTFTRTTFDENDASDKGAGLYCELTAAGLTVDTSTFTLNIAANKGGGINAVIHSDSTASVSGSSFKNNRSDSTADDMSESAFRPEASGGGAIFAVIEEHASLAVTDSTLSGNIAQNGGGILANMPYPYYYGHRSSNGSALTITRTRFDGNRAVDRGGRLPPPPEVAARS